MMPIAIMRMKKASAGVVYLPASFGSGSTGSAANVMFKTDGYVSTLEDGVTANMAGNSWLSSHPDATNAALYEIRRTQVSGSLGVSYTGTMTSGTWYPMTSQRGVSVASGVSGRENTSTWEIRLISNPGTILATATVIVTADP